MGEALDTGTEGNQAITKVEESKLNLANIEIVNNPSKVEKILYYDSKNQLYFVKWIGSPYKDCNWTSEISKEMKDKYFEKSNKISHSLPLDMRKLSANIKQQDLINLSQNSTITEVQTELFNSFMDVYINSKRAIVHTNINDRRHLIFGFIMKEIYNKSSSAGPYLIIADSEELNLWKDLLQNNSDLEAIVLEDDEADNEIIFKYEMFLPEPRNEIPKIEILILSILTFNEYKSKLQKIQWAMAIIDDPAVFADFDDEDYNSISSLQLNCLFILMKKKLMKKLTDEHKFNIMHVINSKKFSEFEIIDEKTILDYVISTDEPRKILEDENKQETIQYIPESKSLPEISENEQQNKDEYDSLFCVYDDPHKDDLWTPEIRDLLLDNLLAFGWGRWREIRRVLPSEITSTMVMDGSSVILYYILTNIKEHDKLLNETTKQDLSISRRQQWYINGPVFGASKFKNLFKREAVHYAKRIICLSAISRYQNASTLNVSVPNNLKPSSDWDYACDLQLLRLVYTYGWGHWREIVTDKTWTGQSLSSMNASIIKKRFELIVDEIAGYGTHKSSLFEGDDELVMLDIITCCRIISYAGKKAKKENLAKWLKTVRSNADAILSIIDVDTAYSIKSNYDFIRRLQSLYIKVGSRFEEDKDYIDRISKYRILSDYAYSVEGLLPILSDMDTSVFENSKKYYEEHGISETIASDLSFLANMDSLKNRAEIAVRSIGGWRGVPYYLDYPDGSFGVTLPYCFSCGDYECALESLGSGNYFLLGNSLCREGLSVVVTSSSLRVQMTVDGPFSFTIQDLKSDKKYVIDNLREINVCGIEIGNKTPESFLGLECGEVAKFFDNSCRGKIEELGLTEYVSPMYEYFPTLS